MNSYLRNNQIIAAKGRGVGGGKGPNGAKWFDSFEKRISCSFRWKHINIPNTINIQHSYRICNTFEQKHNGRNARKQKLFSLSFFFHGICYILHSVECLVRFASNDKNCDHQKVDIPYLTKQYMRSCVMEGKSVCS